jgi:crossover junction endodeoxyribonuclease RuvC
MIYVGIDPGASGGIAIIDTMEGLEHPVKAHKMPGTSRDILDLLTPYERCDCQGVLEKVHSMPEQGVASTFKFGVNFGELRMALTAAWIPFQEVTPQKWQKFFSLPTLKQCGSKTAKKNKHKEKAQQLFPGLKITHAIADALLIAEYCRRTNQ